MKLRTRRIQKLIEAYPRVRTHTVHVCWDIYGIIVNVTSIQTLYMNIGSGDAYTVISDRNTDQKLACSLRDECCSSLFVLYLTGIRVINNNPDLTMTNNVLRPF